MKLKLLDFVLCWIVVDLCLVGLCYCYDDGDYYCEGNCGKEWIIDFMDNLFFGEGLGL